MKDTCKCEAAGRMNQAARKLKVWCKVAEIFARDQFAIWR